MTHLCACFENHVDTYRKTWIPSPCFISKRSIRRSSNARCLIFFASGDLTPRRGDIHSLISWQTARQTQTEQTDMAYHRCNDTAAGMRCNDICCARRNESVLRGTSRGHSGGLFLRRLRDVAYHHMPKHAYWFTGSIALWRSPAFRACGRSITHRSQSAAACTYRQKLTMSPL